MPAKFDIAEIINGLNHDTKKEIFDRVKACETLEELNALSMPEDGAYHDYMHLLIIHQMALFHASEADINEFISTVFPQHFMDHAEATSPEEDDECDDYNLLVFVSIAALAQGQYNQMNVIPSESFGSTLEEEYSEVSPPHMLDLFNYEGNSLPLQQNMHGLPGVVTEVETVTQGTNSQLPSPASLQHNDVALPPPSDVQLNPHGVCSSGCCLVM